jgi:diguanylate cyclase (GGDEF)-like protein
VLAAAVLVYVGSGVPGVRTHTGFSVPFDGWLQCGVLACASALIGVRACSVKRDRGAWACIAAGLSLYAAGQLIWVTYVQYQARPPTPSVADACWLASYPFFYAGVIRLARQRGSAPDRLLRIDGIIIALGLSAYAMTVLGFTLHGTHAELAATLTTMAYPVGDAVLLVILIGSLALQGWRAGRAWTYLGLGLGLFAAADTIYVIRVASNTYQAGTLLDPVWVVGAAFMAAAAWRRPSPPSTRAHGWAVLAVPTVFTVAAVGLLTTDQRGVLSTPVRTLAAACVLAGLVRAAFTFHAMQTLVINGVEARTDELTGLANRRAFVEAVERRIQEARGQFSVMLLDLDRFKEVNDSLGHLVGDQLLREVGMRLQARMRQGDFLARLGGDEFAILLDNTAAEPARAIAERVRLDLQQAFINEGVTIYSDASCGVALWPDAASTVGGLLQRADIAMYDAKRQRLGTAIYAHVDETDLSEPLRLVEELRLALEDDQLVLHFQPKIDLQTGELRGVEALVRWQHPQRGLLAPDEFLPQAERYGLMRRLTTSVLTLALDYIAEWQMVGFQTTVAVNISASSLLDVELPEQIRTLLELRSLEPAILMLEVTETMLMVDPARAADLLDRLQVIGVKVSIDDYGTGYSSLARLRELPVNELKLDRSFLAGISGDTRAGAIVRSTVELAHSLGLTLVAEGIETEEDEQILRGLACDLGQGYHLAPPLPADELVRWVGQRAARV